MTKNNVLIVVVSVIMLAAASALILSKKNRSTPGSDMLPVALHTLKMADGWGYEILVDNKVYIHQDCIPAIPSYKKFVTEAEALTIGNKVIEKIKQGHKPVISVHDIDAARIHY